MVRRKDGKGLPYRYAPHAAVATPSHKQRCRPGISRRPPPARVSVNVPADASNHVTPVCTRIATIGTRYRCDEHDQITATRDEAINDGFDGRIAKEGWTEYALGDYL